MQDGVKLPDTSAAKCVESIWQVGYQDGHKVGWKNGYREGRSTLSSGWFILVSLALMAGAFCMGFAANEYPIFHLSK